MHQSNWTRGLAAAAVVVLGCVAVVRAEEGVLLRYKFAAGDKQTYTVSQDANQAMGQMKIVNQQVQTVVHEVLEGSADAGKVVTTVTAMKVKMETPMGKVDFDSANPEQKGKPVSPMLMAATAMLDAKITFDLSSRGEVKKLSGLDKAVEKMGPMGMMVQGALESQLKSSFITFPEQAVVAGDHWVQVSNIASPQGSVDLAYEYTFTGVEKHLDRECAKLTVVVRPENIKRANSGGGKGKGEEKDDLTDDGKGDQDKDGKSEASEAGNPAPAIGQGTVWFDIAGGYLVESTLEIKNGGNLAKTGTVLNQ